MERLFAPGRVASLLEALLSQKAAKEASVDRRALALKRESEDIDERLKRIYRSIEDGIVNPDEILKERIQDLQDDRAKAKAALERIGTACFPASTSFSKFESYHAARSSL